jgi:hypothetical protein
MPKSPSRLLPEQRIQQQQAVREMKRIHWLFLKPLIPFRGCHGWCSRSFACPSSANKTVGRAEGLIFRAGLPSSVVFFFWALSLPFCHSSVPFGTLSFLPFGLGSRSLGGRLGVPLPAAASFFQKTFIKTLQIFQLTLFKNLHTFNKSFILFKNLFSFNNLLIFHHHSKSFHNLSKKKNLHKKFQLSTFQQTFSSSLTKTLFH